MRKGLRIKHLSLVTAILGLGVASVRAISTDRSTPWVEPIPGGEIGAPGFRIDDEIPAPVLPGFRPEPRSAGHLTPIDLPATADVKPGSQKTDGSGPGPRALPNALELEKLRSAREAVAIAVAAGTRELDSSGFDEERETSTDALAEKERRLRTLEPKPLPTVPGGAR